MKTLIIENNWMPYTSHGWGNGYVLIPQGHKLHSLSYDELNDFPQIDVNGGLTFSELVDKDWAECLGLPKSDIGMWCVGFDTAHYRDTLSVWPKEKVQEEADRLLSQLQSI